MTIAPYPSHVQIHKCSSMTLTLSDYDLMKFLIILSTTKNIYKKTLKAGIFAKRFTDSRYYLYTALGVISVRDGKQKWYRVLYEHPGPQNRGVSGIRSARSDGPRSYSCGLELLSVKNIKCFYQTS